MPTMGQVRRTGMATYNHKYVFIIYSIYKTMVPSLRKVTGGSMTDVSSSGSRGDPAAVAAYVASITGELSRLARASGLGTLAYILEMARLEAKGLMDEAPLPHAHDGSAKDGSTGK